MKNGLFPVVLCLAAIIVQLPLQLLRKTLGQLPKVCQRRKLIRTSVFVFPEGIGECQSSLRHFGRGKTLKKLPCQYFSRHQCVCAEIIISRPGLQKIAGETGAKKNRQLSGPLFSYDVTKVLHVCSFALKKVY